MKANADFLKIIQAYIEKETILNKELAEATKKEDRNFQGCADYIMQKAKDKAEKATCVAMTDDEVYSIAKEYFLLEVIEKPKKPLTDYIAKVSTPKPVVEKPKVEKKPEHGMESLFEF